MQLETIQLNIRNLMLQFVNTIKGATAQNNTTPNSYAEIILIPLLRETFGWENLKNLNSTQIPNYPAIDLADDEARIAIQVTSSNSRKKIQSSIEKFISHKLDKKYDRLIFYFLNEKPSISKPFDEITDNYFTFDIKRDLLDYTDVLKQVNTFQVNQAKQIEEILENNFNEARTLATNIIPASVNPTGQEQVFLNLLEIELPQSLYIGSLNISRSAVIKESKRWGIRLNRRSGTRDVIKGALEQAGLGFGTDWKYHNGNIITFHNLSDTNIPLHHVIDAGTVETFTPKAFYNIDNDHKNVFKSLLWRCMQQMLFHRNVQWQNEDKLFIFRGNETDERKEKWYGRNTKARTVYRVVRDKENPSTIWKHEHFGFRCSFKDFNNHWYIVIKPEWFASTDGYRKSHHNANFVDYKKRQEDNQHVNTHVRFIAHFLSHHHAQLFDEQHAKYPFLSFGEFISFDNAPALEDNFYLPSKRKAMESEVDGSQLPLFD